MPGLRIGARGNHHHSLEQFLDRFKIFGSAFSVQGCAEDVGLEDGFVVGETQDLLCERKADF